MRIHALTALAALALAAPAVARAQEPGALPRDLAERIAEVLNDPAVKDPFVSVGFEMVANTPAQFAEFQQAEFARWKKVIEVGRISVE